LFAVFPLIVAPLPFSEASVKRNPGAWMAIKIKLFRSLFRGREEVYPRRFESRKTGKSAMRPLAPVKGFEVSAKSLESNARNVSSAGFFR